MQLFRIIEWRDLRDLVLLLKQCGLHALVLFLVLRKVNLLDFNLKHGGILLNFDLNLILKVDRIVSI